MLLLRCNLFKINLADALILLKFLTRGFFRQQSSLLLKKIAWIVRENPKLERVDEEFVFRDVSKEIVEKLFSLKYELFVHIALRIN
jgi:hypothetical protein